MTESMKRWFIYFSIILLQIVTILYWATQKENFIIDDLYTMEAAHTCEVGNYIYKDPEFAFNKWVSNSVYKKRLVVTNEDSVLRLPVGEIIRKIILDRNYNILLNISMSLFGYTFITVRPALFINIIFFIISELLLMLLLKRMGVCFKSRALAITLFGFSVLVISSVNYVRFYSLAIMFAMMIFNLLYKIWKAENTLVVAISGLAMFILAYLSFRDTELTMPYFGALCLFFWIALVIRKKWKKVAFFSAYFLIGGAYISLRTEYVRVLFDPIDNSGVGVHNAVSEHIRDIGLLDIFMNAVEAMAFLFSHYFADAMIALIILIVITFGILMTMKNDKLLRFELKTSAIVLFTIYGGIVVISKSAGMSEMLCYLVLALIMVYLICSKLKYDFNLKKLMADDNACFMLIIVAAIVMYILFVSMGGIISWKYCFPITLMAPIVLWYIYDRVIDKITDGKIKNSLYAILAMFVMINAIVPFLTRNIEYIYEDDAELKNVLENYNEMQVVMISKDLDDGEGTIDDHELYDCVWQMSDAASIYCVDINNYNYKNVDYPEKFLLWSNLNKDLTEIIEDLSINGYDVNKLGANHVSIVYYCDCASIG